MVKRERHWTELVLSIVAMATAVISLWIAIGTERTNRQLVTEASWPFLQLYTSTRAAGRGMISLSMKNFGVGPAKIETFEMFWNGKPYRTSLDLLKDCCGYKVNDRALGTSEIAGTVLRAGDSVPIIRYGLAPNNSATWHALDNGRFKLGYRVCYCSVFDECWLTREQQLGGAQTLNPPRVKKCPQPAVAYIE
jgi:hypothetical protein